ncbi:hypothetical protein B0T14DRAFT_11536 [Immersiella caudata]|uniref:Uncharacterized protein n=1 Tax=Immersiella caudata TaxID=314043 RepID=A0AA39XDN9_9PEZI|nr:hypothetical protein B0T14DRAFT_11536 [Immersiella caudata]
MLYLAASRPLLPSFLAAQPTSNSSEDRGQPAAGRLYVSSGTRDAADLPSGCAAGFFKFPLQPTYLTTTATPQLAMLVISLCRSGAGSASRLKGGRRPNLFCFCATDRSGGQEAGQDAVALGHEVDGCVLVPG